MPFILSLNTNISGNIPAKVDQWFPIWGLPPKRGHEIDLRGHKMIKGEINKTLLIIN